MKNIEGQYTGFYSYYTSGDGLCSFDTKKEAMKEAEQASKNAGYRVEVYSPTGRLVYVAGNNMLTLDDWVNRPDVYGYED
jgi:hypothetical protein